MEELKEKIADELRKLPLRDPAQSGGELDELRIREAVRAALRAIEEAGFAIMPKKPTDAMRHAGYRVEDQQAEDGICCIDVWSAMVAAAPKNLNLKEPRG